MNHKYYTPDITEFHVGFEYEFRPRLRLGMMAHFSRRHEYVDWWKKAEVRREKITLKDIIEDHNYPFSIEDVIDYNKDGAVRVKYLDQEDIERLGFKRNEYENGILRPFRYNGEGKIEYKKYLEKDDIIICWWKSNPTILSIIHKDQFIYNGSCKNISKLKTILKDIGI